MIVNRLRDHIKGTIELSRTQVRAAEILLRKVLPDLATVELQAGDGGPILIVTGIMRPDEPKTIDLKPDQAQLTHSPKVVEQAHVTSDGTPQAVAPAIDMPAKTDDKQG